MRRIRWVRVWLVGTLAIAGWRYVVLRPDYPTVARTYDSAWQSIHRLHADALMARYLLATAESQTRPEQLAIYQRLWWRGWAVESATWAVGLALIILAGLWVRRGFRRTPSVEVVES